MLCVAADVVRFCREVITKVDWSLILVFILKFVHMQLLTQLHVVQSRVAAIQHVPQFTLLLSAMLGSQVISNVPATILLVNYSTAYKVISFGVNAGGFGLAIGPLANIIALRIAKERHLWRRFHLYSFPFNDGSQSQHEHDPQPYCVASVTTTTATLKSPACMVSGPKTIMATMREVVQGINVRHHRGSE